MQKVLGRNGFDLMHLFCKNEFCKNVFYELLSWNTLIVDPKLESFQSAGAKVLCQLSRARRRACAQFLLSKYSACLLACVRSVFTQCAQAIVKHWWCALSWALGCWPACCCAQNNKTFVHFWTKHIICSIFWKKPVNDHFWVNFWNTNNVRVLSPPVFRSHDAENI
jgi:hypothetical protein